MKIASVTFFDPQNEVGGGSVPAFAFKEWCDLLKAKCEVVAKPENAKMLCDNYDAIFFNTPPRYEFDWQNLNRPFILMIHDETDLHKYSAFSEMVRHKFCVALAHIDHDGDMYADYHPKRIAWHPCCRPQSLLYPKTAYQNGKRILYAARIVAWKNPHLLKQFSISHKQQMRLMGRVDDHAYARKHELIGFGFDQPNYTGCDLFWDVCGTETNKMLVHRMNLAAFEAINNGLMPIVNPEAIPHALRGAFIEADPLNFDAGMLDYDIAQYRNNKQERWNSMLEILNNSYASFNRVQYRVVRMLNCLGGEAA